MKKANKTVIITGGNAGLGYQAARVLARTKNWHIILASRSSERTRKAAQQLQNETKNTNIQAMQLDLASQASIRQFAEAFRQEKTPPLGAIICNAGVTLNGDVKYSKEGIEKTFAVNHLGHFLLVNLLLKDLTSTARIVFVSSGTHIPAHKLARASGTPAPKYTSALDLAYPEKASQAKRINSQSRRYTTSKLCNVLCTYELSRQLQEKGLNSVNVYAIDPGLMPDTQLSRDYPQLLASIFMGFFKLLQPFVKGIRSSEVSGQDLARLITDTRLNQLPTAYFDGKEQSRSSKASYDLSKARDLWETSIRLTRLSSQESLLAV